MLRYKIRILIKFINFRLKSKPKGGHGIHSPFVYELYTNCIDTKTKESIFDKIESLRKELLKNTNSISIKDLGMGPSQGTSSDQTIGKTVKKVSVNPYMGELLYRLSKYLKPESIIELGTSTGFSTMYLASGYLNAKVTSIEGDSQLAALAKENFNKLGISNVTIINGEFDSELPKLLVNTEKIDLVFIDGNHSKEATIRYFKLILEKANSDTLIIFDDIRWSEDMENGWNNICNDSNVSISIDLFNCGLVFFRKGIVKQHFNLRYGPF